MRDVRHAVAHTVQKIMKVVDFAGKCRLDGKSMAPRSRNDEITPPPLEPKGDRPAKPAVGVVFAGEMPSLGGDFHDSHCTSTQDEQVINGGAESHGRMSQSHVFHQGAIDFHP